jgi:hypothetical protein
MDQIGDIGILHAQLADAQASARLWLAVAESNEERIYVQRMQERIGDLERILDRIELRGASGERNRWDENVKAFLEAFRGARRVRGCVVGTGLSPLAARLGKQAERSEGGPSADGASKPTNTGDGTSRKEEKKPLSWQEIEIAFLSDERVEIRSGTNSRTTYNYGELGFEDRRNGKPSLAWARLRELARRSGDMPRPLAGKGRAAAQKRIEEIREKLRSHFKIEGDPIPFNGNTYKASFKVACRQSFDT